MNLISRRDVHRIVPYHLVDSLAVAPLIPIQARVGDVGTGAGLPGIPLALARPDTEVLLIESSGKRCRFLQTVKDELDLSGVEIVNNRAEVLAPLGCDVVVGRLAAPTRLFIRHVRHHLGPRGRIVLFKTKRSETELVHAERLLDRLRLRVERLEEVSLPTTGTRRRFVVIGPAG